MLEEILEKMNLPKLEDMNPTDAALIAGYLKTGNPVLAVGLIMRLIKQNESLLRSLNLQITVNDDSFRTHKDTLERVEALENKMKNMYVSEDDVKNPH